MRRLAGIIFRQSSQQSYSFHSVWNGSLHCAPQGQTFSTSLDASGGRNCRHTLNILYFCDKSWPSTHLERFEIWKETFYIWKCTLNGVNNIPEVRVESPWRLNLAAAHRRLSPPLPLWVASLRWLSVSLVMSLAALTQVICMQADRGWDARQRQWCTYHFPRWLIEDCNLCRTFPLITDVSGQNKDSELPMGTVLIQGFQPSRVLKSAFKVSSSLVPFTLLLQVSDRMHLLDSGQMLTVWKWQTQICVLMPKVILLQVQPQVFSATSRETRILHFPLLVFCCSTDQY